MTIRIVRTLLFVSVFCVSVALPVASSAAIITILNLDSAGEGFNDPAAAAPVGGNPGTTLGAQRLNLFQAAATVWGGVLNSGVPIVVGANFDPLFCDSSSAVLGSAGPETVHKDFPGAPLPDTYYPQALANSLSGSDNDPAFEDIGARFNSSFGTTCSFPAGWYYGLDGNPPGSDVDLFSVVLHEIGHGLGFLSLVSLSTGNKFLGSDDSYMVHLEDHSSGLSYPDMTSLERQAASTDTGDLHWTGPAVVGAGAGLVSGVHPSGHVEIYAPSPLEGGSSVSHFSNALSPNELMEPAYTGPSFDLGLAVPLMVDLGWQLINCGDGVLDPGEDCDDGNNASGDCCSAVCSFDPLGAVCEEGDLCTVDSCDGSGFCVQGPPPDCDDGNICTDDSCDSGLGCLNVDNTAACDDGLVCTVPDQCSSGICVGNWDSLSCALDDFKLYKAKTVTGAPKFVEQLVTLDDLFESKSTRVLKPRWLGNPTASSLAVINVPEVHLECYKIRDEKGQLKFEGRRVDSVNAFGSEMLDARKAFELCVPSAKDEVSAPEPLPAHQVDHFKCYKAKTTAGTTKFVKFTLPFEDQFEAKDTVVLKPARVCSPVDKNGEGVNDPTQFLECYKIKDDRGQIKFERREVFTHNQFGAEVLTVIRPKMLCVPSAIADQGPLP